MNKHVLFVAWWRILVTANVLWISVRLGLFVFQSSHDVHHLAWAAFSAVALAGCIVKAREARGRIFASRERPLLA